MEHLVIILVNMIRTGLGKAVRALRRRLRKLFKQHWPEVPARIEVVSVFDLPEPSHFIKTYVGILTYFYRNPDLHTGDYKAEFDTESQAQWWVQQFKGRRVNVRVNPRNLDDSVLLQLPFVPARKIGQRVPALPVRHAPRPVKVEPLSPGQRTLAEYSQLVSMAGLGATLVVLCLSIATGTRTRSQALWWLGGALLAAMLVSLVALSIRVTKKHSFRTLKRFYALWSPARTRRVLALTGPVLAVVFLLSIDRTQIPAQRRAMFGTHLPYFAAAWGFLTSWAMHTAILRSQQNVNAHHRELSKTS